jgi:purine-binding chemotaxis protein CheW
MTEQGAAVADGRILLFRLAGRIYGCSLSSIREIIPYRPATRLPGAPPYVSGLINLRGTIVTVVNMGRRLGVSEETRSDGSIILVEHGSKCMGFEVDEVMDVQAMETDRMESPGDVVPGGENIRGIVRGMGHLDDAVVIVLDVSALVGQILL